jgi:hypothetical protein
MEALSLLEPLGQRLGPLLERRERHLEDVLALCGEAVVAAGTWPQQRAAWAKLLPSR